MRLLPAALLALLTMGARASHAQTRIWRPEERVLITSFNNVLALAWNGRNLYDVTENGVGIYDPVSQRWSEPSTVEDGFPAFARPVTAFYSRSDAGLWLRTANSGWYLWSEVSGRWDAQPFGPTNREPTLGSPTAPQNDIGWRVLSGTAGIDPSGRHWQFTSVIPADREGTYWAGTNGGGLMFADTRSLNRDWIPFGSLSRGASALAADRSAVWIGGDGLGPRDGITRASADLQTWTWYEPFNTRAPRGEVTRMLLVDGAVWAASTDGVYVLDQNARSWRRLGEKEGLASDNVRTLAINPEGLWAGTRHGIELIDTTTRTVVYSAMPDARIGGLAAMGRNVWVASERGLWIVMPTDTSYDVRQPAIAASIPLLRGPVESVAVLDSSLYVLAGGRLLTVDGSTVRDAVLNSIGRAYDLRAENGALYVLGTQGIARWRVAQNDWSYLMAPGDVPAGPVYDVVPVGEYTWLATPAGALRVLWR